VGLAGRLQGHAHEPRKTPCSTAVRAAPFTFTRFARELAAAA